MHHFSVTLSKENTWNISTVYEVFHKIRAQVNLNKSYNDIQQEKQSLLQAYGAQSVLVS